jgi:hypothetical protein
MTTNHKSEMRKSLVAVIYALAMAVTALFLALYITAILVTAHASSSSSSVENKEQVNCDRCQLLTVLSSKSNLQLHLCPKFVFSLRRYYTGASERPHVDILLSLPELEALFSALVRAQHARVSVNRFGPQGIDY